MQPITVLKDSPLNRLFFAINHYVSTGDHVGEGIAVPDGSSKNGQPQPADKIRVLLLVNTTDPTDRADFTKFRSRFEQVQERFRTRINSEGRQAHFEVYSFPLVYSQADDLARALTEQPGPLGWGSMKDLIEKHFPG